MIKESLALPQTAAAELKTIDLVKACVSSASGGCKCHLCKWFRGFDATSIDAPAIVYMAKNIQFAFDHTLSWNCACSTCQTILAHKKSLTE